MLKKGVEYVFFVLVWVGKRMIDLFREMFEFVLVLFKE